MEVTKNLSEILIFKVLPFRSYERIGMPIPFDSPVKLLNTYNNGFLTFEQIGITLPTNSNLLVTQSTASTSSPSWPTIPTSFLLRPTAMILRRLNV